MVDSVIITNMIFTCADFKNGDFGHLCFNHYDPVISKVNMCVKCKYVSLITWWRQRWQKVSPWGPDRQKLQQLLALDPPNAHIGLELVHNLKRWIRKDSTKCTIKYNLKKVTHPKKICTNTECWMRHKQN